jgi:glycerophosphoryl diester phosphodiesterase
VIYNGLWNYPKGASIIKSANSSFNKTHTHFTVFAHRGLPTEAPENTLASMKAAKKRGATHIEFDVRLTKDNVPIIFHDDSLERTTNGKGEVDDKTWDELKDLDAGSWFPGNFKDEKIPTLKEWLSLAATLELSLNIELKVDNKQAQTMATILIEHLTYWPQTLPKPLISSFNLPVLNEIKERTQAYPMAFLRNDPLSDLELADFKKSGFSAINNHYPEITEQYAKACEAAGLELNVYTVNDVRLGALFKKFGVSGIFTNSADLYHLEEQPCRDGFQR